jgi:molecular chaperone DnaK
MVKDAEANAASDKEKSEQIDLKNQSDALVYQTRKQLEELGDKVPSEQKTKLDGLISKLEEAATNEDYASMKELNESIKNSMMEIGQQVYSQTPDGAGGTPNTAGDDAIETDFSTEK